MSIFLSDAKKGSTVKLIGFNKSASKKTKRRLLELGFLQNSIIKLDQISFLNEVLLVELNGYLISLRKDIAKNIVVEMQNKGGTYAK